MSHCFKIEEAKIIFRGFFQEGNESFVKLKTGGRKKENRPHVFIFPSPFWCMYFLVYFPLAMFLTNFNNVFVKNAHQLKINFLLQHCVLLSIPCPWRGPKFCYSKAAFWGPDVNPFIKKQKTQKGPLTLPPFSSKRFRQKNLFQEGSLGLLSSRIFTLS